MCGHGARQAQGQSSLLLKGLILALILCWYYLEILNSFFSKLVILYFVIGLPNCTASTGTEESKTNANDGICPSGRRCN